MIVRSLVAVASLALLPPNGAQTPPVRPAGVPLAGVELPKPPPASVPKLRIELPMLPGEVGAEDHEIWKPICSQTQEMSAAELNWHQMVHKRLMQNAVPLDGANRQFSRPGLDLVFHISPSVPTAARTALHLVEDYVESQFRDRMQININISFAPMGSGVLGATSSSFRSIQYANARPALVGDMDSDDTVQAFLPTTTTLPVRFTGTTGTVSNATNINYTFANWRACGGTINSSSADASMTFNSQFNWDYDPSDGIATQRYSFVDTIIHEVGHAMGFTSGADSATNRVEALDMYRFQRTDGTSDFNPDDSTEFQAQARLVDFNTPNDDANTDLITVEYRMSDGDPYQASHFREQVSNIGIMDPAIAVRQTFYPTYYSAADAAVFDAIGWDR